MVLDLQTKQQLTKLLAKPALVTQADAELLKTLVHAYPFYQPLHLLLAKATANDSQSLNLATAALYNGGGLLHQALHQPERFLPKPFELVQPKTKTIIQPNFAVNGSNQQSPTTQITDNGDEVFEEINENLPNTLTPTEEEAFIVTAEQPEEEQVFEEINENLPNILTPTEEEAFIVTAEQPEEEIFEEINENLPDTLTPTEEEAFLATAQQPEEEIFEEINENLPDTLTPTEEEAFIATAQQPEEEIFEEINENLPNTLTSTEEEAFLATAEQPEEEIFEEINENLPDIPSLTKDQPALEELENIPEINEEATAPPISKDTNETYRPSFNRRNDAPEIQQEPLPDELAIGSIVATDFFAFEQNFSTDTTTSTPNSVPVTFTPPEEYNVEAENHTVSKYDDDKLPYTFLWWLAKTRKEHAQIFQPYVTTKREVPPATGELQHQYVEHIFHLQTPFNIADEANRTTEQSVSHRGEDIIDSFIKNEPQIGAPKAELINNENKAKKSAEDSYDLVSETLAAIYIEQMLYHKAIDTYEKLSLKFPEKSRYFADLIQSLEKKI